MPDRRPCPRRCGTATSCTPRPASPTCSTSTSTSSTRSPARRPSTACASPAARVRRPELTVATEDHNVPTERHRPADRRPDLGPAGRGAAREHRRVRHHQLPDGRPRPGHRPRHRPRAGPHAAGDDDRLRRQPHRHPRRVRRARLRHRHERGRARARHPDAAPGAGRSGWRSTSTASCPPASRPRTSSSPIIGAIGTGGGIGHVIEYRGSAIRVAVDGGPDDGLQHVDRGRAPRPGWSPPTTRRSPTSRAAPTRPTGAAWERGARRLAHAAHATTARRGTSEVAHRRRRRCARTSRGAPTPARSRPIDGAVPSPDDFADADDARDRRPGARVHGPRRRARRSATSPSTRCSSARARTAASRTCAPPPRCSTAAT